MSLRKFIFLEEIDAGFSISNAQLVGHVQFIQKNEKIQMKIFIENIMPGNYGIDLIYLNTKTRNIGKISVKNKLQEELKFKENLDNIYAVMVYPLDGRKTIAVAGYLNQKDKINLQEVVKNKDAINNKIENTENKKVSDQEKEKIKKPINSNKNQEIKETIQIKNKIDEENTKEEFQEQTNIEIEDKDEYKKIKNFQEGAYNNQIYYLWENIDFLDTYLDKVDPFKQSIKDHKWWVIKENNCDIQYYCILYNGYLMPMVYPFMNYKNIGKIYSEDNNWIFGIVTQEYNNKSIYKYFVYGIPGRFYMQEQPFKGSTGYLYWQSKDVEKDDKVGYWLLYVDIQTGKIVIPRRPVKPPLNKNIIHNDF